MKIEQEPIFKPKTHIPHVITTFKTKRDMHRLYKWIQEHKFIELAVHIEGKELYLLRSEPGPKPHIEQERQKLLQQECDLFHDSAPSRI